MQNLSSQIPSEVLEVIRRLEKSGFEAWMVGGCIRDLLIGQKPKDWDITTNASPEKIQEVFENTFYTNEFGTVGVVNENASEETLKVIQITPYRLEGEYSDARRPNSVIFSQKIEDDLKRRDFTVNSIAYDPTTEKLLDLYGGVEDIHNLLIKAVGNPEERFSEDALRLLRAVRMVSELNFSIEENTKSAMEKCSGQLEKISKERIRDELVRIINSENPKKGFELAHSLGLLRYIVPELERGIGVEQNQAHSYDVFEHNVRSLQHAADKKWPFPVRIAALFHDIGKPQTRKWSDEKKDWTFHGHEVIGAKMVKRTLEELKFSRETIDTIEKLVRWHMFFSDPDKVTLSAVRRIVRNVGPKNIDNLMKLRICDRIGTGRPKEQPFRFRKYQSMIEEALQDPISVGMLKIDGHKIMEVTREKPGPRLGWILHGLLEEVLDDPKKNTSEYLENKARELNKLKDSDLKALGVEGKEKKNLLEVEKTKEIRKKYFVQ